MFGNGPLANHALGTIQSLNAISLDDVRTAHEQTYCRSRLWVGISGNDRLNRLEETIDDWATALPQGETLSWDEHASPLSGAVLLVHKPQRTQAQILLGHPSIPATP